LPNSNKYFVASSKTNQITNKSPSVGNHTTIPGDNTTGSAITGSEFKKLLNHVLLPSHNYSCPSYPNNIWPDEANAGKRVLNWLGFVKNVLKLTAVFQKSHFS
jgi:hypothetical protein